MDETAASSLYLHDAGAAAPLPPLTGQVTAEVAIIGGGFTGLSTALHLAELGSSVVLADAFAPGWGASGRNGGQLNPGLKYDPSDIIARLGQERGARLVDFAWGSVDQTAALIGRLGIDCELRRNGTLRAVAMKDHLGSVRRSQDDMAGHGMPVRWLGADEVASLVGHTQYHGAFLDARGGDLQPLLYARGLARAAAAAGARLHGGSRATALSREGGRWRITFANGASLLADRVLVAANGYADNLVPGLRQAVVPVFSSILASHPLPPLLAQRIMAGRQSLYEAGLVTVYCRVDQRDRLIIGGRGPMSPSAAIERMSAVRRHAERLWPELAAIGWMTAWNGRVAMTTDHLPQIQEPAEGLFTAYGYNGRGVALSGALGSPLAKLLAGRIAPDAFPIPLSSVSRFRFHRFWKIGVHAAVTAARLRAWAARD